MMAKKSNLLEDPETLLQIDGSPDWGRHDNGFTDGRRRKRPVMSDDELRVVLHMIENMSLEEVERFLKGDQ